VNSVEQKLLKRRIHVSTPELPSYLAALKFCERQGDPAMDLHELVWHAHPFELLTVCEREASIVLIPTHARFNGLFGPIKLITKWIEEFTDFYRSPRRFVIRPVWVRARVLDCTMRFEALFNQEPIGDRKNSTKTVKQKRSKRKKSRRG
jgi:hypothetical protein